MNESYGVLISLASLFMPILDMKNLHTITWTKQRLVCKEINYLHDALNSNLDKMILMRRTIRYQKH